jgi:hypothetical protein
MIGHDANGLRLSEENKSILKNSVTTDDEKLNKLYRERERLK